MGEVCLDNGEHGHQHQETTAIDAGTGATQSELPTRFKYQSAIKNPDDCRNGQNLSWARPLDHPCMRRPRCQRL